MAIWSNQIYKIQFIVTDKIFWTKKTSKSRIVGNQERRVILIFGENGLGIRVSLSAIRKPIDA